MDVFCTRFDWPIANFPFGLALFLLARIVPVTLYVRACVSNRLSLQVVRKMACAMEGADGCPDAVIPASSSDRRASLLCSYFSYLNLWCCLLSAPKHGCVASPSSTIHLVSTHS